MKKTSHLLCILALAAVMISACTDGPVDGVIYHDRDRSSLSEYVQAVGLLDARLPGIDVHLLNGQTEQHTVTALDGSFAFEQIEPGTYLIDLGIDASYETTSNNRSLRLPAAVRQGEVHIVAIGDSVTSTGSEVLFCERLAHRISDMVPATFDNLAVHGSRSWDWLPGADRGYFEQRLAPVLPNADVLTMTLGANDLDFYVPPEGPPYDPFEILQRILEHSEYLLEALPNVVTLTQEILNRKPDCDIVYVIYWNVANSEVMAGILGELQPLGSDLLDMGLAILRSEMADLERILLADIAGRLEGTWIDPYLLDEKHPNDLGHQLHADVIFRALGGVVLPQDTDVSRLFGLYAPDLLP
jgi:lysophospholipase L1-like esterase